MYQKLLALIVVLGLVVSGCAPITAPAPDDIAPTDEVEGGIELDPTASVYTHPDGLFTAPIPINWTVETEDDVGVLTSPDGQLTVYLAVWEEGDLETAIDDALARFVPAAELHLVQTQTPPPTDGLDALLVKIYEGDTSDELYYAIGQLHEGRAYLTLLEGTMEALQRRGSQFNVIQSGFTITALERDSLTGVEPLPFTPEIQAELEAYIVDAMAQFETPGVAVSIVQDGEIVYAQGFGMQSPDSEEEITADTLMMIGSTTKTFTTLFMAGLVDEGLLTWDTPVVDLLPDFAVADPALTPQITVENLVCNCTGVSRRDLELIFNAQDLSAEDVIESLATFEFFTDFGEAFQYSNQMIATAGYAAAAAVGGEYGDLYNAYAQELDDRILEPMGMTQSTLSFDEVIAGDNYAVPYGLDLSFTYAPIPLSDEAFVIPVAPAGALWSSAEEMGLYLLTLLNEGVTPDGERIVSTESLAAIWTPQVPVSADASYGLGWFVGEYKEQPMLYHGGATIGYMSDLALLPEAGLGISVLTNARASLLNEAIRYRILELLFAQEHEMDIQFAFTLESFKEQYADEMARVVPVEPDAVTPYLGNYFNDALGAATLELEDDMLFMDVGEFRSELQPQADDAGEVTNYITFDAPALTGLPVFLEEDEQGTPEFVLGVGALRYTFERVE